MSSPSYNTTYELNDRTVVFWGRELVAAGTPTAAWTKEEFGTFSWTPNPNIWVNNFRTGFPSRRQGSQQTWRTADWTLTVPAHSGGVAGYAATAILGDVTNTGTADTKSGTADPYTHVITPGANGTRCVPFSLCFVSLMDSGGTPGLQFTYSTIKQVKFSGGGGAPLMAEIQATAYWPTPVTQPEGSWNSPNTYTFGYGSNHSLFQAAAPASTYTAQITDADITLSRGITALPSYNNNGSQNPIDIIPLDLSLQASVSLYYDGMGTGKHYSEFLNYLKSGSAAHPNILKWTDANAPAHSIELDFWPAAWSTDAMSTGDGVMTCQATLDAEQDFSSATSATPVWSLLKSLTLVNNVSSVMAA